MATPSGSPQKTDRRLFGTMTGVFTPTLLTILGVIMFLRLPWVVGNGGLLGGALIVVIAMGISLATGLSLSSIATNTRLGAGGPYAIISKSLGIEVGGSVGVPLYISQALAVAMYIFGFREGWLWIFPDHPALVVDLLTFAVVFGIAFLSAGLAFSIQYLIMAVIIAAVGAVLGSAAVHQPVATIQWWGTFPGAPESGFSGTDFWVVFAVFFPAATGIMAGANMSGELKNPRRNIPAGTLSAIVLSLLIYLALAWWSAQFFTPEELTSNYTIMVDKSLWGPLVLAGLLGATLSSALTSLVGAPRILLALSQDGLFSSRRWLAQVSKGGEPRRGLLVSGALVLVALLLRDLNIVAPLITMFFLITYAVINVVVLVEAKLGLTSFRPSLRIPWLVPLVGAVGTTFVMFIVNPMFSLVAVGVVVAIFFWILLRGVAHKTDDVRSGIFAAFAEWAAGQVIKREMNSLRAWKPSLMVPVQNPARVRGEFRLLVDLCQPDGSIKLMGLATTETARHLTARLADLGHAFRKNQVFTSWAAIDAADAPTGTVAGLQALSGAFFRPNILFLNLPKDEGEDPDLQHFIGEARRLGVGVMLLGMHEDAGLGRTKVVNVWLTPQKTADYVRGAFAQSNLNLAILTAYRLARTWQAELNLLTAVPEQSDLSLARWYIDELRDLCRIPDHARTHIMTGNFLACVPEAPQSDLDIMGLQREPDIAFVRRMIELSRSSCLFTSDSGNESAFA